MSRLIYKLIIDPLLRSSHRIVLNMIDPGSKVIDIACGPGSLVFTLANKASHVVGIDISEPMISGAVREAGRRNIENVEFMLKDATDLSGFDDDEFDFATISMAVHQFPELIAHEVLREMLRISKELVIMDYMYPMRYFIPRILVYFIEWIAGGDHYRNFRKYMINGGIEYYLSALSAQRLDQSINSTSTLIKIKSSSGPGN